ncbi:MAG TPA: ABC transporter substrate-binding protein [Casimicrobiaceae bacterium]|nr:ABC transporter substrate-binding protein [Casimicrobiaceae bacterium]
MRRGLLFAALLCAASSVALAADPGKVIRYVFPAAETGFDPAGGQDLYSGTIEQAIFDRLLTYDYLARPAKIVPGAAEALPQVSDDGRTYTFRIRKGIYFTPDPAFNGRRRELVAEDFVYSLKRLIDPKLRSPWAWLVEGKIVGLDELAAAAAKSGRFDYDRKIPGLEAVDRYTLRIRLKQTDYNLPFVLAHEPTSAVAREVIEKYADESGRAMSNPVGTGPYMLKDWVRASKIVLEANPGYRGFVWDFQPGSDPDDARIVKEMKGKKMPQVGRVEISIIEEDQARLLAFERGEIDIMNMEAPLAPNVLDGDKLKPEFVKRGVRLSRFVDPEITYHFWNMQDPVVGGLSKEKIALRRAMGMAFSLDDEIRIVRNGQAIEAQYPIPPGVVGHDPGYRTSIRYDPAAANALLDRFGYLKGADGFRTLPDGKPLVIKYTSRPDTLGRQQDELWAKAFALLGIRMEVVKLRFPDQIKAEKECKIMMRSAAWIADYPDGDNFMQLLYSKNIHQNNNACATIPEYDRLYERSARLPASSPERDRLYHEMTKIIEAYAPWRLDISRYRNMLTQPQVLGYKKHPILHAEWMYIDVKSGKGAGGGEGNAGGGD